MLNASLSDTGELFANVQMLL